MHAVVLCAQLAVTPLAVAAVAEAPRESAPPAAQADEGEAVLLRALASALANDFEGYLRDVAPERCEQAEQKAQLQRYEFKRFSAQAAWYVADPKKPAVTIVRRDRIHDAKVKLFVQDRVHKDAMPRPIELSRIGGRWYITANSL
jgi:hypothetical protein